MTRTTTAAAIAAAIAATVAIPAGAASAAPTTSAPAAQATAKRYVKGAVFLQLEKKKVSTSYSTYTLQTADGRDSKGHLVGHFFLQTHSGPRVRMRVITCGKNPFTSDWEVPPRSTVTSAAVRKNGHPRAFRLGTCFRIQAKPGKGTVRGRAYY
ncbi:hypothetical protein GCM10023196_100900 [Actinoallomurus vinaceus]|uniref:Secreted protein n=1 Tax=Actinoallomurus vinaceus TaxID=1080074 RepID=A0ABP8UTU9_9ACTN